MASIKFVPDSVLQLQNAATEETHQLSAVFTDARPAAADEYSRRVTVNNSSPFTISFGSGFNYQVKIVA